MTTSNRVIRSSRFLPLIVGALSAFALTFAGTALAQDTYVPAPSYTEIKIPVPSEESVPGTPEERAAYFQEGKVQDLSQYIGIVYNFLISIVGLLASVMMIIGGFQYLTSAGDSGKISAAKSRMANAFIGMILALGAYTILQTINPALLKFRPLSGRVNSVLTELTFLPWCEDVAKGTPADTTANPPIPAVPARPVTPLAGNGCGSIGEFKSPSGLLNNCVYRGTPCGFHIYNKDQRLRMTCMQYNLTSAELRDRAKKDPGAKVAECLACSWLGPVKMAQMGYDGGSNVCEKWQTTAAYGNFDRETGHRSWYKEGITFNNKNYISYCGYSQAHGSCVQSDMNCPDLLKDNDERPDPAEQQIVKGVGDFITSLSPVPGGDILSGAVGIAGEGYAAYEAYSKIDENFGCEGYDEGEKTISWTDKADQRFGVVSYLDQKGANLENYPDHLEALCKANPCNGGGPKGCSGSTGLVVGFAHLLSTGKVNGVTNCRNK